MQEPRFMILASSCFWILSTLLSVLFESSALVTLFRISRESQVVKSYYLALRDRESYVSLTCFTAWKGMGCLLEKYRGKHRSLCDNKVLGGSYLYSRRAFYSSTTRIVSRGRSSLPIFLRRDRKGKALSRALHDLDDYDKIKKISKVVRS